MKRDINYLLTKLVTFIENMYQGLVFKYHDTFSGQNWHKYKAGLD